MANDEHLNIIKQGVKEWNEWRRDTFRGRPDLSGGNLMCADLRGSNLRGVNLNHTDLRDAILIGADLHGESLVGSRLDGADLRHAILMGADLREVNLSGADLREANLIGADLREANMSKSYLSGANLSKANLSRANLSRTVISSANLRFADLSEAKLTQAHLEGSNLSGANFDGTDLSDAEISAIEFADTDLSTARGLESVHHLGPSSIAVDVFYKSAGNIPEVFLRGVGLPEIFITYLPSLVSRPIQFYSCFISYSHNDKLFARRLHDSLQGRGIRCWLDEHQILPGDKIYTEVDRGIRLWDKVLLCCSKDSLKSWWVDNEIKIAFDKEQGLWKKRRKEVLALIPVNLDGYLLTEWRSGLATEVKSRMAANFEGWEYENEIFEEQFERLVRALRTDRGRKEPAPPTRL
jgi:uncharacterized protein YjbI with pentapeptide repeats